MDLVDQISAVLLNLIRAGAIFRLVYCMFRLISTEDEAATYKKRARNVVIFYLIAELIWQFKDLIISYYK